VSRLVGSASSVRALQATPGVEGESRLSSWVPCLRDHMHCWIGADRTERSAKDSSASVHPARCCGLDVMARR
jgi:hypothetical protein